MPSASLATRATPSWAFARWLPEGRELPAQDWDLRHAGILVLVWLHAAGLVAFGLYRGYAPLQAGAEGGLVALIGLVASWEKLSRRFRCCAASLALVTASAILVQFSGGYIEAHFHFFVVLAVVSLYQDWAPFLLAVVYVAVDHGAIGTLFPAWVYNHPDAIAHPWKWAAIHAAFVFAESAALLAGWKVAEEARSRTSLVLESAGDGIVGVGADGRVIFANPVAATLLRAEDAGLRGRELAEFVKPGGDRPDPFSNARSRSDQSVHRGETLLVRARDGSAIPAEWVSTPIAKGGVAIGSVITLKDISERKRVEAELDAHREHLEETVRQRTAALRGANRELEAFSYSVSHDLRAPLRSLDGFSHALIEDYGGKLDERGLDYLQRVRKASQRMARLIDDLLTLSRVTRAPLAREPVDLSAMARAIVGELRAASPERDVDAVVAEGLAVRGDARLLQLALQNLLGNAWKFTSKHERARIEFGAEVQRGRTIYHVRDDGAGFDMAYAGKLFGAFQRLHTSDEFEGTGIGLATVQRVIRQHGGSVWARGAIERGSTFFFTLNEYDPTEDPHE
ncbi:MAG: hypothetical protein QOE90_3652 [Thermoplasmata archaeon]|jgi:PAS domain S-box-containing protein|nr:hypothetical protein [Thermoplasmata archaeon]